MVVLKSRRKARLAGIAGTVVIVIGLWIVLAPFARPVPGGVVEAIEVTPEAHCGSALLDTFRGDATATATVAAVEVATLEDPQEEVTVECSDRARTRVLVGLVLVLLGGAVLGGAAAFWVRQSRSDG